MKLNFYSFASVLSALVLLQALGAQAKGGSAQQRPEKNLTIPPDTVAMPDGGFLSDIEGKWDCGEFGTVVFKQSGSKVTGTYGEDGKITGTLKGTRFTGTWSESGGSARGRLISRLLSNARRTGQQTFGENGKMPASANGSPPHGNARTDRDCGSSTAD